MTWLTHAAWYGYPTPRGIKTWAVRLSESDPHVVAEGIRK